VPRPHRGRPVAQDEDQELHQIPPPSDLHAASPRPARHPVMRARVRLSLKLWDSADLPAWRDRVARLRSFVRSRMLPNWLLSDAPNEQFSTAQLLAGFFLSRTACGLDSAAFPAPRCLCRGEALRIELSRRGPDPPRFAVPGKLPDVARPRPVVIAPHRGAPRAAKEADSRRGCSLADLG